MSLISLPSVCLQCPHVLCSPVQGSVAETTLHMMAAVKSSAKLENQRITDYKITTTEPRGNFCGEVDKYYIAEEEKIADFGRKITSKFIVQKRLTAPCWKIEVLWIGGKPPQHI